jgi:hypothetical protein
MKFVHIHLISLRVCGYSVKEVVGIGPYISLIQWSRDFFVGDKATEAWI